MNLKLAILASGSGSNAEAIFSAIKNGYLNAEVCLVICNVKDAKVLSRAQKYGIPHVFLDHKSFENRESYDRKLCELIKEKGADTIVMAGYMRLVTAYFLKQFQGRVLNIHPAILPSFPGVHGAKDAVDYGVKFSGCTVHFVTEQMDEGPIIIQGIVPCWHGETEQSLKDKIHKLEHKIFVQALQWLAENRLLIMGRIVHLLPKSGQEHEAKATIINIVDDNKNEQSVMVYPPLEIMI